MSDKLFFACQSALKYWSFDIFVRLRSFVYRAFFLKFGKKIEIKDGVTIKYPSEIEIGDNAKIGEMCYLVGKGGLRIGSNFLMGAGSKIITSAHRTEDPDRTIVDQGLTFEPIEIGDNVWLGFDVKVFGNTKIGTGVILGANTLVKNTSIPDYAVVVGCPGRIIRYRYPKMHG